MKLIKSLAIIISMFLLCIATPVMAFDKVHGVVPEFQVEEGKVVNLDGTIVQVLYSGSAIGIDYDHKWREGTFKSGGVGTVIHQNGNIYVVTAAHVVSPSFVVIRTDQYVYFVTRAVRVKNSRISIGKWSDEGNVTADILYIDPSRDLAILKVSNPKLWAYKIPAKWETVYTNFVYVLTSGVFWVPLIQEGDAIALPVRGRDEEGNLDWTFELREGYVISPNPYVEPGSENLLPFLSLYHFTMLVDAYPGDSGSPILAFDNGQPVIIGVMTSRIGFEGYYLTYGVTIDMVKWIIEATEAE